MRKRARIEQQRGKEWISCTEKRSRNNGIDPTTFPLRLKSLHLCLETPIRERERAEGAEREETGTEQRETSRERKKKRKKGRRSPP